MVGVGRRMNKLKQLLSIRHGPGAAILPSGITRIHMEFSFPYKTTSGHYGPRKFWRRCLPRLKYWNPSIPMIVNHTKDESTPATLRIYFRQGSTAAAPSEPSPSDPSSARGKHQHVPQTLQLRSSTTGESPAPAPEADERVVTLDVKGQDTQRILEDLLERTGAVPVVPTAAEELEMQEVAERRERAKVDREVMRKHLEQQKREEALMAQARSEAAALKDAL